MVTRSRPLKWAAAAACVVAALALFPSDALAQRRGRPARPVRGRVVVAAPRAVVGFGYGYYDPFWGPWGWGPSWSLGFGYPFGYPPFGPAFAGAAAGSARLRVSPTSAEVYVDGYMAGVVDDFDGFFQRLDVAPGEHELTFYLDGFQTVTQRVLFQPGRTLDIRYDMQPLAPGETSGPRPVAAAPPMRPGEAPPNGPPPMVRGPRDRRGPGPDREPPPPPDQAFGTLAVRLQPSDATLFVDGEEWAAPEGPGPILIDLPAGTHEVEVRRDDRVVYQRTVDVRPGRTLPLNVSVPR
ncbi:MAG: PEGA domain-containing protein [Vicinamibacterales bacterium]